MPYQAYVERTVGEMTYRVAAEYDTPEQLAEIVASGFFKDEHPSSINITVDEGFVDRLHEVQDRCASARDHIVQGARTSDHRFKL